MSDDLIERLREAEHGDHARGCEGRQYACSCGYDYRIQTAAMEAADLLASIQADNLRLKAENERIQDEEDKAARDMQTVIQGLRDRATAAEAELDRVRKALGRAAILARAARIKEKEPGA